VNERPRAAPERVDARELIDLASALIRIPSFKTEETAVALCQRAPAELALAAGPRAGDGRASAAPGEP
jgi:hypothetical protein